MSEESKVEIVYSPGFDVKFADGFSTSILYPDTQIVRYQFTFWLRDLSPDTENKSVPLEDPLRFQQEIKTRAVSAITMDPSTAYSLALNILQNLSKLSEEVREARGIKFNMRQETEGSVGSAVDH